MSASSIILGALLDDLISRSDAKKHASPEEIDKIYASYMEAPAEFRVGDIVKWKTGLKHYAQPAYGEIAVVAEVLQAPVYVASKNARDAGVFREPLDIVLALLDDDGDVVLQHFDKRRFVVWNDTHSIEAANILRKRMMDLITPPEQPFKAGDIVVWKQGLRNHGSIKYDEHCLVVEVFEQPIPHFESDGPKNCNFLWSYTMNLACYVKNADGRVVLIPVDGRRFKKV